MTDIGISENLRQALLFCDENNDDSLEDKTLEAPSLDEEGHLLGLPERPLYRDLAHRLYLLSTRHPRNRKASMFKQSASKGNDILIPAAQLSMTELSCAAVSPLPSKATVSEFSRWFEKVGDDGVLRVLGLRSTIGTVKGLLPPSWSQLLAASAIPNSSKALLSVAARARAKHAHRGAEKFFGIVKGSQASQNEQAQQVLLQLIKEAVWINIHTFSGMEQPVLEIRNANGYGARWKAEWKKGGTPIAVIFRGFLEPQMADGHEKGWKH